MTPSELDAIDHALRGALNTIRLNLQLLAPAVERDAQARPMLERVSAELTRLASELLPAVIRIVSVEVGGFGPVDLGKIAAEVLTAHGLEGESSAASRGPVVRGDPELLATAIGHLVRNAVAATPPDATRPEVTIDASAAGSVAIAVRNACSGPASPLNADGVPAARGRLGGVLVAKRVARLHGGTLTYEYRDGALVARLSIPAASSKDDSPRERAPGRRAGAQQERGRPPAAP